MKPEAQRQPEQEENGQKGALNSTIASPNKERDKIKTSIVKQLSRQAKSRMNEFLKT